MKSDSASKDDEWFYTDKSILRKRDTHILINGVLLSRHAKVHIWEQLSSVDYKLALQSLIVELPYTEFIVYIHFIITFSRNSHSKKILLLIILNILYTMHQKLKCTIIKINKKYWIYRFSKKFATWHELHVLMWTMALQASFF